MKKNSVISDLEEAWIEKIRQGEVSAFNAVFEKYYVPLSAFAAEYVKSFDTGREIVQEVFLKIWLNKEDWKPLGPLKPYLYKSVYNQALNYIEKDKTRKKYESQAAEDFNITVDGTDERVRTTELRFAIRDAVRQLPEKRHMVFVLSRQHGLSNKEIAAIMNISPKTVENQMTEALRFLHQKLDVFRK